jgi:hypothetical protein
MLCLFTTGLSAQRNKVSRYETFVYTNGKINVLIQQELEKQKENQRGFLGDLGGTVLNAGKGIVGGYFTSVFGIGANAIVGLINQSANNKIKWEEIVKAENSYQENLATIEPINNFYSRQSFFGPMDPDGMNFSGIGCVRTIGNDTVFYISCHIDESKISRIINHSKFELSLDTLIIDPYQCDLPNSNFDKKFSFEQRNNLQMIIEMHLISSWINQIAQIQSNQELGNFTLSVPISPTDLNEHGKLHYVKPENAPAKYIIIGESFVVPRSYMGYRDENNKPQDSWGTGDYKIALSLKETCGITNAYRKNWKADWKTRRNALHSETFIQKSWKTFTSQRWDENGKKWVITTVKAPAGTLNNDVLKEMNLPESSGTSAKQ